MLRDVDVVSTTARTRARDNMVWRIAELIHVSARDRTVLRNQMAPVEDLDKA